MFGRQPPEYRGAHQIPTQTPFDSETNFVDLHQDFPVSFEKYVMGLTPFMRASRRIGGEALQFHGQRLATLDHQHGLVRDFKNILKIYARGNPTPFKMNCKRIFDLDTKSSRPEDINASLYILIAKMMRPFAYPGQNEDATHLFTHTIIGLSKSYRAALDAFMAEVVDIGFLKKLQLDCLEIYPRILAAEIPLRPALFLDFDHEYEEEKTPMRVSVEEFETYKDLYKDIAEIVGRQINLLAGLNNLLKRGGHNTFKPGIGLAKSGIDHTPKSLAAYADIDVGRKLDYIDDSWYDFLNGGADSQLRNAIAHYKTDYDDVKQLITYFPRKEGMKEEKSGEIYFLEFLSRTLLLYREMHSLHHLIKCLFFYEYLEHRPLNA